MYVKSYAICLRRNQGCLSKGCSPLRSYFLLKVALFFFGGGRMLGFPWILYMGMSQKKHKRCYQNQPFPKDFGEVPTFGNIPIWRHSPTGRLFLSPEVSLNRQASRHIKSRLQMQLLNLWCAFVAPISGWQMVFFFQLWHHFGRVQWLFGVAYWTTSCSPSSN